MDVGIGGACQKGPWPGWSGWGGAPCPLPQLLSELVTAIGREDAITSRFRRFLFKQVREKKEVLYSLISFGLLINSNLNKKFGKTIDMYTNNYNNYNKAPMLVEYPPPSPPLAPSLLPPMPVFCCNFVTF